MKLAADNRLWSRTGRRRFKQMLSVLRMFRSSVFLLPLLAALLSSCVSVPGARQVSGRYVNSATDGFITFDPNGRVWYWFTFPEPEDQKGCRAHYSFAKATDDTPYLAFPSDRAGLFRVRFSDSGDRIFVTAKRVFDGERVYERVSDAR